MNHRAGLFITLEGGEGVGKSTAAAGLAAKLQAEGCEVVATREPGGTKGAEAIRALLLKTDTPLLPLAQTMLHFAARADHVETVLRPALARGAIVICDRYHDSTMAYQAYGQGVDIGAVASLVRIINLTPDITFILELPEFMAKSRLTARGQDTDRYERMGSDFTSRVAQGFRAIAAAEPGRSVLVDATMTPDAIVDFIRRSIAERTGR
jgi:dTMP kinase